MRPLSRAALVVLSLALSLEIGLTSSRAAPSEEAPFTMAIVRADGVLVPFAAWTGKVFENPWPTPKKEQDTPITLDAIPRRWWSGKAGAPSTWFVWKGDGITEQARAVSPTWFPAHCQQGIGLRTSLQLPAPPPARVQPYPKLGIATSRPMDVRPIEALDPKGQIGAAILRSLPDVLDKDEDRLANQYLMDGWKHPFDDAARRRIPISVEALYRTPTGAPGAYIHYFEAVKRYPKIDKAAPTREPAKDSCEVVTFVVGWFIGRTDDTSAASRVWKTQMTSCDYESADVMLPLAYITMKDTPVWVAQLSGWGRERYALIDSLSTDETTMGLWAAPGGFCLLGK